MKKGSITALLIFLVVVITTGCSHQSQRKFKSIGMPEEVYIKTFIQQYHIAKIMICPFRAPDYAVQVGEKASRFLYLEMLKSNLRADVISDDTLFPNDADLLVQFMKKNKCDLIITGDVLHYLDGGISTDSRVIEEIKVYGISAQRLHVVGFAKAVETASPAPWKDYIFVQKSAQSAPSAESLLKRNSVKFVRLLENMFSGSLANGLERVTN